MSTPFTGVAYGSIAFSDVNSDGKPDVLISGVNASYVRIAKLYTNSGTNFTEVMSTPFTGVAYGSIAFSDVNSDGKPDVLITGQDEFSVRQAKLYTNSGTNFTEVTSSTFTGVNASSIAFSDVNSDGKPDVLITGYSITSIAKLYTNSGTNFTEVTSSTFTGVNASSIAFSDVNSDGKPDVLITGQNASNVRIAKLYTNSGTNFTEVTGTTIAGVSDGSIAFSDVNSDGKPDVLISGWDNSSGIAKLYTNSGTNFTEVTGTPFAGVYNSSIAFSDVNSDGKPDVLVTGLDISGVRIASIYINTSRLVILTQPIANTTVCGGSTLTYTVSATGLNLSYTWYKQGTSTSLAGQSFRTLTLSGVSANSAGTYYAIVQEGANSVTSTGANLVVNAATSIATQPISTSSCSGTLATFMVSATGANLNYIWSNGLSTNNTMSTSVAGSNYLVTVSGTCGASQASNAVSLTGIALTNIELLPAVITVCSGITVPLVATATGSNLVYAWSTGISGANATVSSSGTYMVTVTGTCGAKVSNAVQVTVSDCNTVTIPATSTGLNISESNSFFVIYPNPNAGTFVIDFPSFENLESLNSYTISSIEGKVLAKGFLTTGKNEISTSLSKGIYFVKVGNGVRKLIIE